jgi:hypothetical protein
MNNATLGDVLNDLTQYSWKNWVYVQSEGVISPTTPCLVIDTEQAELGSDDFTPLEAEKHQLSEFLSIQDLKDIVEYLERSQTDPSIETKCAAAAYYFKNDAFMPKSTEHDVS